MTQQAETIAPLGEQTTILNSPDEGIDLLDFAVVLLNGRRLIGTVTLAALVLGALIATLMHPVFTASALIMPPQQQQSSASAMMGQLGSLLGGGGGGLGLKNPADMYIGILGSRTIADKLIEKFDLRKIYKTKKPEDTREALKKSSEFEASKDGLIHISVTYRDPKLASDLANAYVDQLYAMNSQLAITEAAQRRVFFDQQLEEEKRALAAAESSLKSTQEKTGLIQLSGQAEIILRTIAELQAQIASREVELQSMRTFATDENPDVTRVQQEISTLRQQLEKLQNNKQTPQIGNTQVPSGRVPAESLEYLRNLREVKYHETLFDLLSRQFEAARIDEAKSAPLIQVIDRAVPPDKKSGPHRLLILLGFTLFGLAAGSIWTVTSFLWNKLARLPENASKLNAIHLAMRARA